jgi:CO/xanthine dehydrogenase FAD-binding subunit
MKSYLPDYEFRRPEALAEALRLLEEAPGQWQPIAGGTDVMVLLNSGFLKARRLLDITRFQELAGIQETGAELSFGSLATFSQVQECAAVHRHLPNLVKSARATGALAIQNRGTLGGNIANASPAADTPPSLLAYGAAVDLVSRGGTRRVPLDRFYLGYKKLDLAPDELIQRIIVPKPGGRSFHFFRKVGTRQSLAITKVSLAACCRLERGVVAEIRVALGSVGPVTLRARNAEALLLGRPLDALPVRAAQQALQEDISPMDDIRSTAHYRRVTAGNILGQMLRELARAGL